MSWAVWAIAASATMRMPLRRHAASQILEITLADQVLLDEDADLAQATLGDEVGQEDRLVGHRPLREGERPLPQPIVGPGDADGRHFEPFLDRLAGRDAVIGDVRSEHREAPLVDQLPEGVDHSFDRTLGQALDLAVNHLDRPIQQALLQRLIEHDVKALGEVGLHLVRKAGRQSEVHQIADLDRLSSAFVGHGTSTGTRSSRLRPADLIFVQTLAAALSRVNHRIGQNPSDRR